MQVFFLCVCEYVLFFFSPSFFLSLLLFFFFFAPEKLVGSLLARDVLFENCAAHMAYPKSGNSDTTSCDVFAVQTLIAWTDVGGGGRGRVHADSTKDVTVCQGEETVAIHAVILDYKLFVVILATLPLPDSPPHILHAFCASSRPFIRRPPTVNLLY